MSMNKQDWKRILDAIEPDPTLEQRVAQAVKKRQKASKRPNWKVVSVAVACLVAFIGVSTALYRYYPSFEEETAPETAYEDGTAGTMQEEIAEDRVNIDTGKKTDTSLQGVVLAVEDSVLRIQEKDTGAQFLVTLPSDSALSSSFQVGDSVEVQYDAEATGTADADQSLTSIQATQIRLLEQESSS